ncbi:hypothetical protein KVR01_009798 [Diaporthe batatas]|uniref:uncharacterized protein n=1 Tax=Diaporthe batatas TaxID=748121 RepID=UPI001D04FD00|nr:uncharacterized protein KVR01_009798 [Diaporthe batatas]KAG8160262.1 hypothetical protein KVR01_009798 [Diaporthe batatas]
MVRTRPGAVASPKGSPVNDATAGELTQAPAKKRGASDSKTQQQGPAKKQKSSGGPSNDASEPSQTQQEVEQQQPLPRLTTPDLEFDWDRSKLKDPRPTPGREARPRYDSHDIPAELAARCPPSPAKPKGRLNVMQKEALYIEKTRIDPSATFHHLHKCRDKGPSGSPTYDPAGFRLDYKKVMNWFKPVAYNKKRMVKGMDRALARGQSLNEHIIDVFFEDSEAAKKELAHSPIQMDLVKDTVSKDLGIPLHKIGHEEIDLWEQNGFEKRKLEDYMTYSEEDKKRILKMMGGSILRA